MTEALVLGSPRLGEPTGDDEEAILRLMANSPSWISPLMLGLTQCVQPVDAPSAFFEEQYLCDAEHATELDARVAACREFSLAAGPCAGIISFRGTIDSQPVLVDEAVTSVNLGRGAAGQETQRGITIWSRSPYFKYRVVFVNMEHPADGVIAPIDPSYSTVDFINLEARGGNYLGKFVHETRDTHVLTTTDFDFAFSTDLESGGHLDGCLHVFFPAP